MARDPTPTPVHLEGARYRDWTQRLLQCLLPPESTSPKKRPETGKRDVSVFSMFVLYDYREGKRDGFLKLKYYQVENPKLDLGLMYVYFKLVLDAFTQELP